MSHGEQALAVAAALADAQSAVFEYDDACSWFSSVASDFSEPLAAEVWVFDPTFSQVLLVRHRWRGWVPPGGAAERGEAPREAAVRELAEETGLEVDLLPRPAAVAVRSYHPDWSVTLGLSYAVVVDPVSQVAGEDGQPLAWKPLGDAWESVFADDRDRMLGYAAWLAQED